MNQLTDLIERLHTGETTQADIKALELLVEHLEFVRSSAIEGRYADSYPMQGPPNTDGLLRLYERLRGTMPAADAPVVPDTSGGMRVVYPRRTGESDQELALRMRQAANHTLDHWRQEYESDEFRQRRLVQPPADEIDS